MKGMSIEENRNADRTSLHVCATRADAPGCATEIGRNIVT